MQQPPRACFSLRWDQEAMGSAGAETVGAETAGAETAGRESTAVKGSEGCPVVLEACFCVVHSYRGWKLRSRPMGNAWWLLLTSLVLLLLLLLPLLSTQRPARAAWPWLGVGLCAAALQVPDCRVQAQRLNLAQHDHPQMGCQQTHVCTCCTVGVAAHWTTRGM